MNNRLRSLLVFPLWPTFAKWRYIGLGFIACVLQACSVSEGPDLVSCICSCMIPGVTDPTIPAEPGRTLVDARVCVDSSDKNAVKDACEDQCQCKSGDLKLKGCFAINVPYHIMDCHYEPNIPPLSAPPVLKGCPDGSSQFAGGDVGQASATTVAPSIVTFSGDDVAPFSLTPALNVQTTRAGSTLAFADVRGVLPDTTFQSSGFFGTDEHTFRQGRIFVKIRRTRCPFRTNSILQKKLI